ncbi:MAG: hypothetical protein Kow0025_11980 [Thermodesulfovibrionales bacterium]
MATVIDNFNDNSIDTGVWNVTETSPGTVIEQNQRLEVKGSTGFGKNGVVSDNAFTDDTYYATITLTANNAIPMFALQASSTLTYTAQGIALWANSDGYWYVIVNNSSPLQLANFPIAVSKTYNVRIHKRYRGWLVYVQSPDDSNYTSETLIYETTTTSTGPFYVQLQVAGGGGNYTAYFDDIQRENANGSADMSYDYFGDQRLEGWNTAGTVSETSDGRLAITSTTFFDNTRGAVSTSSFTESVYRFVYMPTAAIGLMSVVTASTLNFDGTGFSFWETDTGYWAWKVNGGGYTITSHPVADNKTYNVRIVKKASGGWEAWVQSPDDSNYTAETKVADTSTSSGSGPFYIQLQGAVGGGGTVYFGEVHAGNALSIDNLTDYRVYQRSGGVQTITISGSYTGSPTAIEYRLMDGASAVTGHDWQTLDASPSGGSFSGQAVDVPEGGWYRADVRFANDTDITWAGTAKWGVGALIAIIGQSNGTRMSTIGTDLTADDLLAKYDGSWSAHGDTGNGAIQVGNDFIATEGVPVGILNYSVDGASLHSTFMTYPKWMDLTAGKPYPLFTAAVDAVGGALEAVIWVQGESDAYAEESEANYVTYLEEFITDWVRTDITNGSGFAYLPFIITRLGRDTSAYGTDASWTAIKNAQLTVGTTYAGCYLGALAVDATLADNVHWTAASYITVGQRLGQTIKDIWGSEAYHRGPSIASADVVDSTHIDVSLTHRGGTDFTPTSGITGFTVLEDGSPVTVSGAARQDASTIRLTLASSLTGGTVTVRYLYGENPTITSLVKDDSALTLPLEEGEVTASGLSVVTVTDTATGADAIGGVAVGLSLSDSGLGSDALPGPTAQVPVGEAGAGADAISQVLASLSVQDSGQGAEAPAVLISIRVADQGVCADAVAVIKEIFKLVGDAARGTDLVGPIAVRVPVSDTGLGLDALAAISAALGVADAARGVDVVIDERYVTVTLTARGPRVTFAGRGPKVTFKGG